jgi:Ca2+-binding EF-hand superfamily protein
MSHPELSPVQLQKFTTLFRLYDRDGDGTLTVSDYVGVAERFAAALGWSGDRAAALAQQRRAAFQKLGAEKVSQAQFLQAFGGMAQLWASGGGVPELAIDCPELMAVLGREQFATMGLVEYKAFLTAIGSSADADMAFMRIDRDDDGMLIQTDLHVLLMEFVTSSDPDDAGNLLFAGEL